MLKNNFPVVILVNPQLPDNIGMSARAMMNCGFNNLRIVKPREGWPNKIAIHSAVYAKKIIEKAKIYSSFEDSISDLNFLIATSIRKRISNVEHLYDYNKLSKFISSYSKVGLVFGQENSGLTNEHISKCNCIFSIPLYNMNNSLNLSHSVLLMCYEISKLIKNYSKFPSKKMDIATKKEFNDLMNHLYIDLKYSGFLHPPEKSKSMFLNIQNMFGRANFSSQEVKTFRGILNRLKKPRKLGK